jgi:cysteine synthase A
VDRSYKFERTPPTPLVPVRSDSEAPVIWCKLEYLNPSGSTKDRIARHILEKAIRSGELVSGDLVVEASSGSTSIALALACARMGLRFLAYLPHGATSERVMMIRAYGGEVRRVDGAMQEVIEQAAAFAEVEGAFAVRQFENLANAEAHQRGTAGEILEQLPGLGVSAVVSGVGTGGTLVGLHAGLSEAGCEVIPVAAIPACGDGFASNMECCSLTYSGKVPGVVDGCSKIYADWRATESAADLRELAIDEGRCLELTRTLWSRGFPVGPSSGLNLAAAHEIAKELGSDAVIVTVFPDRMERYFSHTVFAELRED